MNHSYSGQAGTAVISLVPPKMLNPLVSSNGFLPGHLIRIEVSSSNFPRFDRNLNTGGNNYDEVKGVVARNSIHHSAQYPSQVTLSVVKK